MSRRGIAPRVGYPSKPRLSESEKMNVLRSGAPLEWFSPFAVLGEVVTSQPNRMPYGLVHWYFDAEGKPQTDVRTFHTESVARWAADWLYQRHQDGCRCIAVFYWTPDTVNHSVEATS